MIKVRQRVLERRFNYICIDMYDEIFRFVKYRMQDSSRIYEVIDNIFHSVLDEVNSNRCVRKNCKNIVYGIAIKEIRKCL